MPHAEAAKDEERYEHNHHHAKNPAEPSAAVLAVSVISATTAKYED